MCTLPKTRRPISQACPDSQSDLSLSVAPSNLGLYVHPCNVLRISGNLGHVFQVNGICCSRSCGWIGTTDPMSRTFHWGPAMVGSQAEVRADAVAATVGDYLYHDSVEGSESTCTPGNLPLPTYLGARWYEECTESQALGSRGNGQRTAYVLYPSCSP